MKHQILTILSLLVLVLGSIVFPANAQQATEISFSIGSSHMQINGKQQQVQPSFIENGTTLVPLRVISEAFGAAVAWDDKTNSVSITLGGCSILLIVGDKSCFVNGEEQLLAAAPVVRDGSTMVPLRFISETFGADVQYDGQTQQVLVTYLPEAAGSMTQFPLWKISLAIPDGWSQSPVGSGKILLERVQDDGTLDFFFVQATETTCSASQWLEQETAYLRSQYDSVWFQSHGGRSMDANGSWTTLEVTVSYPAWKTSLREQYMQKDGFGYFVRYGQLTPPGAASAGQEVPWVDMEQILDSLAIPGVTQSALRQADPHWDAVQRISNKYNGWQMDLPETFQTVSSTGQASVYEQPGQARLAIACTPGNTLSFDNVIPFSVTRPGGTTASPEAFSQAFHTQTVANLQKSGVALHSQSGQQTVSKDGYVLESLSFVKDGARFHTQNYFFSGSGGQTQYWVQVLMPEETSNWLALQQITQSLETFRGR